MHLLSNVLYLLIGSRLLGELMHRLKQPRLVGEIFAGIILGPALLSIVKPTLGLEGISELSVFLIVVSAGLEMEFRDVISAFKGRASIASLIGFLLPFAAGCVLALVFGLNTLQVIFLGLCMSVTALPVTVQILSSFRLLQSRIAHISIATAILNDVLALLFLGVLLDFPTNEAGNLSFMTAMGKLSENAVKVVIFAFIVYLVNRLMGMGSGSSRRIERFIDKTIEFFGREALFGIAVLFVLLFGTISEWLGTHFVIGTFFGALLLSRDVLGTTLFSELEQTLNSVTGGFLAPIFFAYLGLVFGTEAFGRPFLLVGVLAVAMLSKIWAGYLGGMVLRLPHAEALGIGVILNGRGVMELVVANIAFQRGLIGRDLFSILVVMGIVTTMATPIMFRRWVLPRLKPAY